MGKPSQAVMDFMTKYKIDSDEIWEVHGSTWVVKHKALERVAAEVGITWDRPAMIETNSKDGIVAMCVFGKLGDRMEWSVGEASPKNCKNSYYYAMSEKRAKDRVILKLLTASGALYSEAEADQFEQPTKRENTHDTLPEDIGEVPGEDIIGRDDAIPILTVDAQRPIFSQLAAEILTCDSKEECKRWKVSARSRASRLSDNWRKMLDVKYLERVREIEKRDADEYIERKTG
jgi:hypothetical protein